MRALVTWSGALCGVLLILLGSMVPAALAFPDRTGQLQLLELPTTLQVPALLLTALLCGPRGAFLAAVAYLTVGLWQLPVFTGGGSGSYLLNPEFGFLAGFLPAAWVTGRLARQPGMEDPLALTGAAVVGLLVMQLCGALNLVLGHLLGRWNEPLGAMLYTYALGPLWGQLLVCCAIGVVALPLRRLLLVDT
ncbi:biotin transporter BioY [Synechococcus sp. RSCCF101]|uniref:biotin transporter BioY n=1 Tax=Synechococcus sp. RSCCF101 TaxID=2511069 RepID=UPI00124542B5|nr:biotin transporter BioY [Synechococcus sp. RSCCF101]QEY31601.1 biotin transporter BioY [Synechococcus sp. RSCCF101]